MSKRKGKDVGDVVAAGGDLGKLIDAAKVEPPIAAPPTSEGEDRSRPLGIFIDDDRTWEMTKGGPVELAPYFLRFTRDIHSPTERTLEGEMVTPKRAVRFAFPSEILGDPRALKKELARLLGSGYRHPRGRLESMMDAWLEASVIRELLVVHDFGFTDDGSAFIGPTAMLPGGDTRFVAPPGSPSTRLRLGDGDGVGVMSDLLDLWPRVLGSGAFTATLLGIAGWGVVAPVLESLDPGVAPLIAFLHGPSGVGKSSHAALVQCFFGDFSSSPSAVPFSSTPLAIEQESYFFRGAVMVVGDVKVGTIAEGGGARVLGLLQRAGDRAERRRLDSGYKPMLAAKSRCTWLLEGEDVPVTDGSALSRLLILPVPDSPRQPELMGRLVGLMPGLSAATRALVEHLLAQRPWRSLLARYHAHVAVLAAAASGAPNGVRLAKSVAAVAVGLEVWSTWLLSVGLRPPAEVGELVDSLAAPTVTQLDEVADAGPAVRFLDLVRQLLASGAARIGAGGDGGEMVGRWDEDGTVAFLLPDAVFGKIRKSFPDAATGLATPKSIRADLVRRGAIVEHDAGRCTKKARVSGRLENTWAIDASLLR